MALHSFVLLAGHDGFRLRVPTEPAQCGRHGLSHGGRRLQAEFLLGPQGGAGAHLQEHGRRHEEPSGRRRFGTFIASHR